MCSNLATKGPGVNHKNNEINSSKSLMKSLARHFKLKKLMFYHGHEAGQSY